MKQLNPSFSWGPWGFILSQDLCFQSRWSNRDQCCPPAWNNQKADRIYETIISKVLDSDNERRWSLRGGKQRKGSLHLLQFMPEKSLQAMETDGSLRTLWVEDRMLRGWGNQSSYSFQGRVLEGREQATQKEDFRDLPRVFLKFSAVCWSHHAGKTQGWEKSHWKRLAVTRCRTGKSARFCQSGKPRDSQNTGHSDRTVFHHKYIALEWAWLQSVCWCLKARSKGSNSNTLRNRV